MGSAMFQTVENTKDLTYALNKLSISLWVTCYVYVPIYMTNNMFYKAIKLNKIYFNQMARKGLMKEVTQTKT